MVVVATTAVDVTVVTVVVVDVLAMVVARAMHCCGRCAIRAAFRLEGRHSLIDVQTHAPKHVAEHVIGLELQA